MNTATATQQFDIAIERVQRDAARAYLQGFLGWTSIRVDAHLKVCSRLDALRLDAGKRRCVRGTACGNSCIAPGKTCRIKGNPKKLGRLKQLLALPAAGQTSGQGPGGARPKAATVAANNSKAKEAKAGKFQPVAELKAAVLKAFKVSSEKELKNDILFKAMYKEKRAPDFRSRGTWLQLYREHVGVPHAEQNQPDGPRVIRGIDVTKHFRPWHVFNLDPNTATADDVNKAFRTLAKKHHPDYGGDPQTFDRLKKMRDTLVALMP